MAFIILENTNVRYGDYVWSPTGNGLSRLDDNREWSPLYSSTSFGAQVIGDFGGDGHLDYMLLGGQEEVAMYGDGAGMLTEQSVPLTDINYDHWVVDINNDGRDDILDQSGQEIRLFLSENRNVLE